MSSSNNTSLLHDEEKKRRFFWSFVWLLLSVVVVLPLTSFVAPFWLVLQIVEAFIPVGMYDNAETTVSAIEESSASDLLTTIYFAPYQCVK